MSIIESRLLFELEHIETRFQNSNPPDLEEFEVDNKDLQSFIQNLIRCLKEPIIQVNNNPRQQEITRKLKEGPLIAGILKVLKFNTDEKGHLIDMFILKAVSLISTFCTESPPFANKLINDGVLP